MRLTVHTDYALRLLMYLALRPSAQTTIQEVAEAYGISRNHMMKVAHALGRAGFVETLRGRAGGLRLARDPAAITVGEVVRSTEEDWRMVECFDPARNRCVIAGPCRLRGVLKRALDAYLAVLDGCTLADLSDDPAALGLVLGVVPATAASPRTPEPPRGWP
ncbi:MAG: RrF2 family transcriptional regulator [Alphaproteobacteria bacterium]